MNLQGSDGSTIILAAATGPTLTLGGALVGPQGPPGVAATSTYTNAAAVPVAIGGIAVGKTFSAESFTQVFNELLYPYQSPAFTSFNISGQANPLEVGASVTGSKTFAWATSNSANVNGASVAIKDGATTLASGLASSGTQAITLSPTTLTSPGSHTWSIQGTDSNSVTFNGTYTVSWLWYVYAGTSANTTLTAGQIQALATANLASAGTGTFSLAAGGYKYFCYPSTLSVANSFTDTSTNLSVTMADSTDDASFSNTANSLSYALVSVTNAFSQTVSYRVYRTRYILGGSITIGVA